MKTLFVSISKGIERTQIYNILVGLPKKEIEMLIQELQTEALGYSFDEPINNILHADYRYLGAQPVKLLFIE